MLPSRFFRLCLLYLPLASAFVHPGVLVTEGDVTRIKAKLAAGREPWLSSWNKLTSIRFSSASYANSAVASIYRGNDKQHKENADKLWHDVAAAANLALRWKVSGDSQFADAAAKILVAWGNTLTSIGDDDDKFLVAGFQGHQMANAAEILRDYAPFAKDGLATVIKMLQTVFLPLNVLFLDHGAPSEHNVKHFFANWELSNLASAMAIGILADNQTVFDYAVQYFKNGTGNGAIMNAVTNIVDEPGTGKPLGQGQESGRDQGHAGADCQLLGIVAQQAYNQGEDLFAFAENRILLGAEYYARYNLGNDVPFEPYTNGIVHFTEISSGSRGATRPAWELLYSHYGMIKGLEAPWTKQYRDYVLKQSGGFEGGAGSLGEGSGHYDGWGWGSFLYRLEASDIPGSPNYSSPAAGNATSSPVPSSSIMSVLEVVTEDGPSSATSSSCITTTTLLTTTVSQPPASSTGACGSQKNYF